jgi:hypothetical protein
LTILWREVTMLVTLLTGDLGGWSMASVHVTGVYSYDAGPAGLAPGSSWWLSWGPADVFETGAVVLTPHASSLVPGTTVHATNVMTVSDIHVTVVPTVAGDIVFRAYHVGANFTNSGPAAIRYFTVTVGVIQPGPDGH